MRLLLLAALLAAPLAAQPLPDPTFSDDGFVRLDALPGVLIMDGARSADGSLTLVGVEEPAGQPFRGIVVRLLASGQVDTSFGVAGVVRVLPQLLPGETSTGSAVSAVAVDAAGRIVVAGGTQAIGPGNVPDARGYALRLSRAGQVDTAFGASGYAPLPTDGAATAVVVTPDGIVVARAGGSISRLTTAGRLDPTFAEAGVYANDGPVYGLTVRPDGRILAVGDVRTGPDEVDLRILSLTRTGTRDLTFGVGGETIEDLFGENETASAVSLLPDGRAVVSGAAEKRSGPAGSSESGVVLYRILADGTPDATFGFEGWTWTFVPSAAGGRTAGRAVVSPSGSVSAPLLGGPQDGLRVVGLDTAGNPDSAYGPTATVRLYAGQSGNQWTASTVDGSTVTVFGYRNGPAGQQTPVVARFRFTEPTGTEAAPADGTALAVAPNPFRDTARIALTLDASAHTSVRVVDTLGRTVVVLADGTRAAGEHALTLDASGLPPGVYAVVVVAGGVRRVARVTVVR